MTIEPEIPAFARVEIALTAPSDLPEIAGRLRGLADELEEAGRLHEGSTAMLVAYSKIKATSKQLRKGE